MPQIEAPSRDVTVTARVVQRLLEEIERAGVSRAELAPAIAVHDADARVAIEEVERLCELAISLTGDEALGLHWAAGLSERTFAPVSHMIAYVSSLRQGFALLSEYERLFCDQSFFELSESGQHATVRLFSGWTFRSPRMAQFAAEMTAASLLIVIRLFDARARIARVCFDYPAPAHHAEYTRAFGELAQFDQPWKGIVFDRALLDLTSPSADSDIHTALQTVAERRLLRVAKNAPLALRVRDLLKQRAPERSDMPSVARTLGLSVRTLRRQLSAEGTSYRAIEYSTMASVAEHLLCDKQLTIQETAFAMGFSGAATFHRALKQWTGMTPSELRERRVSIS